MTILWREMFFFDRQHAVLEATGFSQPNLNPHRNPFSNPAILFLLSDAAYYLTLPSELDPGSAEDQVRSLLVQDQIRRCADSIFVHFKNWATSDPSGRGGSPLLLGDPNPLHGLVLSTVHTYLVTHSFTTTTVCIQVEQSRSVLFCL